MFHLPFAKNVLEDAQMLQVGVVFYLDDLTDVSEESGDEVKYASRLCRMVERGAGIGHWLYCEGQLPNRGDPCLPSWVQVRFPCTLLLFLFLLFFDKAIPAGFSSANVKRTAYPQVPMGGLVYDSYSQKHAQVRRHPERNAPFPLDTCALRPPNSSPGV